jgi:hypothetical protein
MSISVTNVGLRYYAFDRWSQHTQTKEEGGFNIIMSAQVITPKGSQGANISCSTIESKSSLQDQGVSVYSERC